MAETSPSGSLEEQIAQWRDAWARHRAVPAVERARAEADLRTELAALTGAGLTVDEAFLVAVQRLGRRDAGAAGFARAQTDRVWRQAVEGAPAAGEPPAPVRREAIVAFSLAVLAAVAVKVPALFGVSLETQTGFYARNASLFVLPCLIGYFAWKRRPAGRTLAWLAAAFVAAAVVANLPGFGRAPAFEALTALHLPIALMLAVGLAHAGGRWGEVGGRMDFIRFAGELFIYFVLIALGGGVLCAFVALTFHSIGLNPGPFFASWLLPCGAAGAVVIAAWLAESRKGGIGNLAPMLTRLFAPLFAAMLVAFLGAVAWSGRGIAFQRELLIGFDLLLVVVLGLMLFSLSARRPGAPRGAFDVVQVVLVIGALAADAVALWAIGARIGEFGFSPNRVAALGENVILLVNLGWSAVLYLRFVLGRGSLADLERWQTAYVPVYAAWAALVVVLFPPLLRGGAWGG